jgi:hypothetical protein
VRRHSRRSRRASPSAPARGAVDCAATRGCRPLGSPTSGCRRALRRGLRGRFPVVDRCCTARDCKREAAPDRRRCDRCLGRGRANYTARVDGARCARCSAPPVPGRSRCQKHLDEAREQQAARAEGGGR